MPRSTRLLSIGEYSAATQLSPKALRLYDEQRLLIPVQVDAATGYRYYGSDQVQRGRLIRALREVGMSLSVIAACVAADEPQAFAMLAKFSKEQDRRYASQKRALQGAITMLRGAPHRGAPNVIEHTQEAASVVVRDFVADRHSFIERFRNERAAVDIQLRAAGLEPVAMAHCALLEPLSDEETHFEIVASVATPDRPIEGLTVRERPAARCAAIVIDAGRVHASEISAATDTLFDWFDRSGHRALGAPRLSLSEADTRLETEILWAFEPARE